MANDYGTTLTERLATPVAQWTQALAAFGRRLRVALPATVVSFDPVKQTVVVQPAINESERVSAELATIRLPQLVDVPVVFPRAGGFALTLPIQAGDECLVVFADACMDAWWQSGAPLKNGQIETQNEIKRRRHALADGIAIFGPWSQPRVLSNYSTSSAQLRSEDGATVIDIAAIGVTVTCTNATVNASGTATIEGGTVDITGSSQVNISGNANTKIEGRNFLTHTHSGVQSGGGVSGPVV